MNNEDLKKNTEISATAQQLDGEDLGAIISDAFEKHLPDPSVLVEPAEIYAEKLTEAALEKLTPLTTIVRDSVEGVAEARLSLQDQAEVIRSSMGGISEDIKESINDLEPLLQKLSNYRTSVYKDSEEKDQVQVMIELRQSIDALNLNLNQLKPSKRRSWFWNKKGER